MLLPRLLRAARLGLHRRATPVVSSVVRHRPACVDPAAMQPQPAWRLHARSVAARSKAPSSMDMGKAEQEPEEAEADEGEDGFLDDDEAEDVAGELGLGEDNEAPGISSGGTTWGEAGVKAAQKVLKAPALEGLELYLFRAIVPMKKLDIRLDKLTDVYGSPSIDDIEKFSRMLMLEMEALLGPEAAGEVSFEVSSPGAERQLQLPKDLERFQQLPLRVEYTAEDGSAATQILDLVAYDEETGSTDWRMADVRANAPVKGRRLSKKQRDYRITIPVQNLTRVRIHVDF